MWETNRNMFLGFGRKNDRGEKKPFFLENFILEKSLFSEWKRKFKFRPELENENSSSRTEDDQISPREIIRTFFFFRDTHDDSSAPDRFFRPNLSRMAWKPLINATVVRKMEKMSGFQAILLRSGRKNIMCVSAEKKVQIISVGGIWWSFVFELEFSFSSSGYFWN